LLVLFLAASATPAVPAGTELLRGTVYSADGSPAAGAIVWTSKLSHAPLSRRETVADAKGRFSFEVEPGTWFIWARRGTQGGEGPARHEPVEVVAGQPPEPVTVRMTERGMFRGRLLEAETGKPIVGGKLFLDAGLFLTTGADGKFEIGGLARTNHESFVVASGRMRMRVLFDTTAKADTELDVPVPKSGKIVGRVTDLDGKPIPGAYVGRSTSGTFFSINALYLACDAAGRFEYDDAVPPEQPTRLNGYAPGYETEERGGLIAPADGKPLELHFKLRPTPGSQPGVKPREEDRRRIVSGIVRGPDGKPAAGVMVRWGHEPVSGAIQGRTDMEGKFRLSVPVKEGILAVLPNDALPEFPRIAAGEDEKVEVALTSGHTARGRVLDDQDRPIADVHVIARMSPPAPGRISPFYWLSEAAVHTDADGRFELKGVPGNASFDFLGTNLSDLRNQELKLDGADNLITMKFSGVLFGKVVSHDGKPIRSFRVLVGFPRDRRADERTEGFFAGYSGIGVRFTSPDGSFALSGVGAGCDYRVTVLAEGHGEAVAERLTALPANRLATANMPTLRAKLPGALRVTAVTSDGQLMAGARVTLVNGDVQLDKSFSWGYHNASWEDMARGRTGPDGVADFKNLRMSGCTVLVEKPGHARHRSGWRDGRKELTIKMTPEAILTGTVRDGAGKRIKECYISLLSEGDQIHTKVGPDDAGRFRVAELPAGNWNVHVRDADGNMLQEQMVPLKAGETKELVIETKKE
jgi:hypothetical protein